MGTILTVLIALAIMIAVAKFLASLSHNATSKQTVIKDKFLIENPVPNSTDSIKPSQELSMSPNAQSKYLGITRIDASRKHNSWLAGLPRGIYSDATDERGRVEVFGYQTCNGELVLKDGQVQPIIDSVTGEPVASGRFLLNLMTGGFHKLYLSQEEYLTSEQLEFLYDPDANASVFQETEMELLVVTINGQHGFRFIFY